MDSSGTAVHKVLLLESGSAESWDALVQRYARRSGRDVLPADEVKHSDSRRAVPQSANESVLEASADQQISLCCRVSNHGAEQIYTGPIKRLKWVNRWFNVLDPEFSLHLDTSGIDSVAVVCRPDSDEASHTLEAFDDQRHCFVKWLDDGTAHSQVSWQAILSALS